MTLAITNMPEHSHSVTPKGSITSTFTGKNATTSSDGAHVHNLGGWLSNSIIGQLEGAGVEHGLELIPGFQDRVIVDSHELTTSSNGDHSHNYTSKGTVLSTFTGNSVTTSSIGSNTKINVMNPYIVTYIWKRTA